MNCDEEQLRSSFPCFNDGDEDGNMSTPTLNRNAHMNKAPSAALSSESPNPSNPTYAISQVFSPTFVESLLVGLGEKPSTSEDSVDITDAEIQQILGTGTEPGVVTPTRGSGETCTSQGITPKEDEEPLGECNGVRASPILEYRDAPLDDGCFDGNSLALIAAAAAAATTTASCEDPRVTGTNCELDEYRQGKDMTEHARLSYPSYQASKLAYMYDDTCAVRTEDDAIRDQVPSIDGYEHNEHIQGNFQCHPPRGYYSTGSSAPQCERTNEQDHVRDMSRHIYSRQEHLADHSVLVSPNNGDGTTHDREVPTLEAVARAIRENQRKQTEVRAINKQNRASVRLNNNAGANADAATMSPFAPNGANQSPPHFLVLSSPTPPLPVASGASTSSAPTICGVRSRRKRTRKRKGLGSTKDNRPKGARGSYKCRLCGQLKANHVCSALDYGTNASAGEEAGTQTVDPRGGGGKIGLYSGIKVLTVRRREINNHCDDDADTAIDVHESASVDNDVEMTENGSAGGYKGSLEDISAVA